MRSRIIFSIGYFMLFLGCSGGKNAGQGLGASNQEFINAAQNANDQLEIVVNQLEAHLVLIPSGFEFKYCTHFKLENQNSLGEPVAFLEATTFEIESKKSNSTKPHRYCRANSISDLEFSKGDSSVEFSVIPNFKEEFLVVMAPDGKTKGSFAFTHPYALEHVQNTLMLQENYDHIRTFEVSYPQGDPVLSGGSSVYSDHRWGLLGFDPISSFIFPALNYSDKLKTATLSSHNVDFSEVKSIDIDPDERGGPTHPWTTVYNPITNEVYLSARYSVRRFSVGEDGSLTQLQVLPVTPRGGTTGNSPTSISLSLDGRLLVRLGYSFSDLDYYQVKTGGELEHLGSIELGGNGADVSAEFPGYVFVTLSSNYALKVLKVEELGDSLSLSEVHNESLSQHPRGLVALPSVGLITLGQGSEVQLYEFNKETERVNILDTEDTGGSVSTIGVTHDDRFLFYGQWSSKNIGAFEVQKQRTTYGLRSVQADLAVVEADAPSHIQVF